MIWPGYNPLGLSIVTLVLSVTKRGVSKTSIAQGDLRMITGTIK